MKTYWDSSAVINAAVSEAVMDRLDSGERNTEHFTDYADKVTWP